MGRIVYPGPGRESGAELTRSDGGGGEQKEEREEERAGNMWSRRVKRGKGKRRMAQSRSISRKGRKRGVGIDELRR